MRTGLTVSHEVDGIKFYGELKWADMENMKLTKGDAALMADVGWQAPAHDTLLVLEMLFRRLHESIKSKEDRNEQR